MNICGIIAEYNPMHLGHAYQIEQAMKKTSAEGNILIMSGNFVQRGEPAIIDKYTRADAAIQCGIDLVVELPVYFSTASAEYFAFHAVNILDATGVVTHLNFGSESGDIHTIKKMADFLSDEPIGYKHLLNLRLKEGHSFPAARQKAIADYNRHHDLFAVDVLGTLTAPNNILGIEYLKALNRLNSNIKPTTVKRIGADYHSNDASLSIPSATSIRQHLAAKQPTSALESRMPTPSFLGLKQQIDCGMGPVYMEDLYPFIRHRLLTEPAATLRTYTDVTEGLENRLAKAAVSCYDYTSFIDCVSTKRYTGTRISRALLHLFLGHKKEHFQKYHNSMAPYLKVLALNENGQQILRQIKKKNETLPIIVNNRQGYKSLDPIQQACFLEDLNSTLLYNQIINTKYTTAPTNEYQTRIIPV